MAEVGGSEAGQAYVFATQEAVKQVQALREGAAQGIQLLGDPEKRKRYNTTIENQARYASTILAERGAEGADVTRMLDPEEASQDADLWAEAGGRMEKDRLARSKANAAKTTVINQMPGTVEPTRQHESVIQDRLDMTEGYLQKIAGVKPLIKPEFFGLSGDVRQLAGKTMGYLFGALPEKQAEWIQAKQELRSFGSLMLYDMVLAMSGKAVTEREMAFIKQAAGDPESMTYEEFRGAVMAMEKVMGHSRSRYRRLLRPGGGPSYIDDERDREWLDQQTVAIEDAVGAGRLTPEQSEKRKDSITRQLLLRMEGREARSRLSGGAKAGTEEVDIGNMSDDDLRRIAGE
jgi:hypothetical protein